MGAPGVAVSAGVPEWAERRPTAWRLVIQERRIDLVVVLR